jgi:hypothetical protein
MSIITDINRHLEKQNKQKQELVKSIIEQLKLNPSLDLEKLLKEVSSTFLVTEQDILNQLEREKPREE